MTETIYKYDVPAEPGAFSLSMPHGATILKFGKQGDQPALWVRVNPDNENERRNFYMVGTGKLIPAEAGEYIGTTTGVSVMVWHLFEAK